MVEEVGSVVRVVEAAAELGEVLAGGRSGSEGVRVGCKQLGGGVAVVGRAACALLMVTIAARTATSDSESTIVGRQPTVERHRWLFPSAEVLGGLLGSASVRRE